MHRTKKAPIWRLKVINGCNRNDDLLLPLVPQSSMLLPFYEKWRDEDEERHYTAKCVGAGHISANKLANKATMKKKKKKRAAAANLHCISTHDWLQKIPHVALGRHTCLPAQYRLRHGSVSRLHCRVVYVSDAATHKQLLSRYPLKTRASLNGFCATNGAAKNVQSNTHNDSSIFYEPYYLLINCSLNQLYVNDELLPCGQSCCLRENDIVAFLENPFDNEGGILEPLRPEDYAKQEDVDGNAEGLHVLSATTTVSHGKAATARALFDKTSAAGAEIDAPWPACLSTLPPHQVVPVFLEANGVRVARYRPQCVPPALLQRTGASPSAVLFFSGDEALPKQRFEVEQNCLVFGNVKKDDADAGEEKWMGSEHPITRDRVTDTHINAISACGTGGKAECLTPPPAERTFCGEGWRRGKMPKEESVVDAFDVIDDVISPLRQRLLPTTQGISGHFSPLPPANGGAVAAGNNLPLCGAGQSPFTVVPPRLPVFLFTRRSPSPEDFTRQASSIAPVQPQRRGRSEAVAGHISAVTAKKKKATKCVDEETFVGSQILQGRCNSVNSTRKKRRTN